MAWNAHGRSLGTAHKLNVYETPVKDRLPLTTHAKGVTVSTCPGPALSRRNISLEKGSGKPAQTLNESFYNLYKHS